MKSNLLNLAVAGLALCAPLALHAQTNSTTTTSATTTATTSTKMAKTEYRGTVKSVDTAANSITVTTKKGDMTFMVDTKTKVMNDKKPATLADITMGEKVSGSYTQDASGMMMACKVNGHPAKAAMHSTTTSSTTTSSTNAAPSTP